MSDNSTDDAWPVSDAPTVVRERDTIVGGTPPPPPVGPPPDRRIGWGMLFGIGAIALVAIGILIAWLVTHRTNGSHTTTVVVTSGSQPATTAAAGTGTVAVPRVVGLKEPQALARLAQVGLSPQEVFRPSKQPKGVVLSQKPRATATAKTGSRVTIVVDAGASKVAVPDVRGSSLAAARKQLDALGLSSTTTQVSSAKPAGTVVDEAPAAGKKLARGSMVTLSVAKALPVAVPNVTGQSQSAAQSALGAAGLTARTVTVHSQLPAGQVTGQHPAAGQQAAKGSSVRINVSDGSKAGSSKTPSTTTATTTAGSTTTAAAPAQPATASVPDVTQQKLQDAVQALNAAGFLASIQYIPGSDPLGTILQQSPGDGATAKTRSHVTINASSGPGEQTAETVPDTTGQSLQAAVSTLNGAHLRLIYVKLPVTDRSEAGKVVEQTPAAGKQAPQNAQILVYLGAFGSSG